MHKKNINLKLEKKTIILLLVYKIIIELVYVNAVSPYFSYMGFDLQPSYSKMFVSYLLLFLSIFLMPNNNVFSHKIVQMFFIICVIPFLSFSWLADKNVGWTIMFMLFFVILEIVVKKKNNYKLPQQISFDKQTYSFNVCIEFLFYGYVFFCIYLGYIRGGIDSRALSFNTIYSLREEYSGSSVLNNYLIGWCAKAFFPVFSVYYLYRKKYAHVFLCVLMQLFLYLCYGYKAYLFSAIFGFYIFFVSNRANKKNKTFINYLLFSFIVLLIPSFFAGYSGIVGNVSFKIMNTFSMRMLYEPARIEYGYFEFFSINDKLFFSEGLIGKLFGLNYPYSRPIGFVITEYMLGPDNVSNQNTGVIADSFAQIGIFGIIIIPILLGIYLKIIDRIGENLPSSLLLAIFAYPVFMLNDNPFFTNLLTNGFVIDLGLIFLIGHTTIRCYIPENIRWKDVLMYGN